MTKELKQEFTLRISQASKTQLIIILYDMMQAYLLEAKSAIHEENRVHTHDAIRKLRGCNQELIASLNLEYELGMNLLSLYLYINRELIRADIMHSVEPLSHVEKIVTELKESYTQANKEDSSGPIMENTQAIYAGLTYGKKQLTENVADQGSNRGFLV